MSYWKINHSHLFLVCTEIFLNFPLFSFTILFLWFYLPFFPNQKIALSKNELSQKGALYKKNQKYSEDVKVKYTIFFNICRRFFGLMCLGVRIFFQLRLWLVSQKCKQEDLISRQMHFWRNVMNSRELLYLFLKGKLERLKPLNLYTVMVLVIFFQLWPGNMSIFSHNLIFHTSQVMSRFP